jgi:hypothetical protein
VASQPSAINGGATHKPTDYQMKKFKRIIECLSTSPALDQSLDGINAVPTGQGLVLILWLWGLSNGHLLIKYIRSETV